MSSFSIDSRIVVRLECDLAVRVGECLLNSGTEDKQILALGHRLKNIEEEEEQQPHQQQQPPLSRFSKYQQHSKSADYGNFERRYRPSSSTPSKAAFINMDVDDNE